MRTYLEYTREQESPTSFHEWTALALIAATLERKVWLKRGYYNLYPNIYVFIVAGSATCRKTASTGIGITTIQELKECPMIFAQKMTPEALITALEKERIKTGASTGFVYSEELSVFMNKAALQSGLMSILINLYDAPKKWQYHTKGGGLETITNAALTILACSTRKNLKDSIPEGAIGGGLTSRIIFVYEDTPREANLQPMLIESLAEPLITDLEEIQTCTGQLILSTSAFKHANTIYKQDYNERHDDTDSGYYGRRHDTAFKVAMLLSLAESSDMIIHERHIAKAIQVLKMCEKSRNALLDTLLTTEIGKVTERIYGIIKKHISIKHTELLRKCWRLASAPDFQIHMRTLLENGMVKEVVSDKGGREYTIT